MKRMQRMNRIIGSLAFLQTNVKLSNSINLTDINIHSENFYRDFLNLVFGYNLKSINFSEQNAAAIDLGDDKERIAIQVTATSTVTKTKKTVGLFIKKKLYEKYNRLIILNITSKTKHRVDFIGAESTYRLNTKADIWDIEELINVINNAQLAQIDEISTFLERELPTNVREPSLRKEIQTFMALIRYLSDENHPSAGNGFIKAPDPEGKINKRFASYASFLTKQYQDLYTEYGNVLADVKQQSDIGHARINRLGFHLMFVSDEALTECGGDAQKALSVLVEKYECVLSKNGIEYDQSAIRFFLVDQLIRCNVFPNKEEANLCLP